MRTLKKTLSLVLVLAMMLSFGAIGGTAAFGDQDEIDPKYADAIEVMNALGIIQGDDNDGDGVNEYRPGDSLTRAQAARIIVAVLKAEPLAQLATCTFTDVPADEWYYDEIGYLQAIGIMKGYGDGTVGPNDELTGAQFCLMLMKAMGVDVSSVNPETYELDTITLAVKLGLGTAEELAARPFTRQLAASASFEGLIYDPDETMGYAIKDDSTGKVVGYVDTIFEAIQANAVAGYSCSLTPVAVMDDSLGFRNFGLAITPTTDAYGRPITSYTVGGEPIIQIAESAPVVTYTTKVKHDDVVKDLSGWAVTNGDDTYKVGKDASAAFEIVGLVTYDGYTFTDDDNNAMVDVANYIAGQSGNSTTIEVYGADNIITKIVIIDEYVDVVDKVIEANPDKAVDAEIELKEYSKYGDVNDILVEGYEKGDVVTFNLLWNADDEMYDVINLALAETVTGTLEKYTSANVLTIDGVEYELATYAFQRIDNAEVAAFTGMIGEECAWYLNVMGAVVHVVGEKEPVEPTTYAYVKDVALSTSTNAWGERSINLQVKVVLTDGSYKTYSVAAGYTTKDIKDSKTGEVLVAANNYYIAGINKTIDGTNDTALKASAETILENKVFAYTLKDGVMTLKAAQTAPVGGTIYNFSTSNSGVSFNANTVFVYEDNNANTADTYKAVTGTAAIGNNPISDGIIVYETVQGSNTAINVAAVVFAVDSTGEFQDYTPVSTIDTDDYVYIDGVYTVSKDANGNIYTYTGVKADGTTMEVTGDADLSSGIYYFDQNNELSYRTGIAGTIRDQIDGAWVIGNSFLNVTDDTVIYTVEGEGAGIEAVEDELAIGDKVYVLTGDGGVAQFIIIIPE